VEYFPTQETISPVATSQTTEPISSETMENPEDESWESLQIKPEEVDTRTGRIMLPGNTEELKKHLQSRKIKAGDDLKTQRVEVAHDTQDPIVSIQHSISERRRKDEIPKSENALSDTQGININALKMKAKDIDQKTGRIVLPSNHEELQERLKSRRGYTQRVPLDTGTIPTTDAASQQIRVRQQHLSPHGESSEPKRAGHQPASPLPTYLLAIAVIIPLLCVLVLASTLLLGHGRNTALQNQTIQSLKREIVLLDEHLRYERENNTRILEAIDEFEAERQSAEGNLLAYMEQLPVDSSKFSELRDEQRGVLEILSYLLEGADSGGDNNDTPGSVTVSPAPAPSP